MKIRHLKGSCYTSKNENSGNIYIWPQQVSPKTMEATWSMCLLQGMSECVHGCTCVCACRERGGLLLTGQQHIFSAAESYPDLLATRINKTAGQITCQTYLKKKGSLVTVNTLLAWIRGACDGTLSSKQSRGLTIGGVPLPIYASPSLDICWRDPSDSLSRQSSDTSNMLMVSVKCYFPKRLQRLLFRLWPLTTLLAVMPAIDSTAFFLATPCSKKSAFSYKAL